METKQVDLLSQCIPTVLDKIVSNNQRLKSASVKRLLIVLDPATFYLGDNCILTSYCKYLHQFFSDCSIYVNYNPVFTEYQELLMNNPHIAGMQCKDHEEIEYEDFDAIILLVNKEPAFLDLLTTRYGAMIDADVFDVQVYSMTSFLDKQVATLFPVCDELCELIKTDSGRNAPLHELFITAEETTWGNRWLQGKGILEDENVIVLIDETRKRKLFRTEVYFNVVDYFLKFENVKLLVLDKNSIGKESFYKSWLGGKKSSRIIFGNGLPLRDTLSILSSKRIKMLFGPCTGLLHCAAGINGNRIRNRTPVASLPLVIVYTGEYPEGGGDALTWWGRSWVDCWVLNKRKDGSKEILLLHKVKEIWKSIEDTVLPCEEYETADVLSMLTNYRSRFQELLMNPIRKEAP